jgi:hypothetical protein
MRRRDWQINVADRSVDGITPALDDRILQRAAELPLELHARQLRPFRRLLLLLLLLLLGSGWQR